MTNLPARSIFGPDPALTEHRWNAAANGNSGERAAASAWVAVASSAVSDAALTGKALSVRLAGSAKAHSRHNFCTYTREAGTAAQARRHAPKGDGGSVCGGYHLLTTGLQKYLRCA